MKSLKKKLLMVGVAVAAGFTSVAAFAQASATPAFSDSAILASVNGVVPIVIDIGGAVLGVVVVAWGYKTVKGFIGR